MNEGDARAAIVSACRRLAADGLTPGTAGNVAVRLGDAMLVTPSGVSGNAVTEDQVVRLRLADGTVEGQGRPSSEWRFHRDILAARPEFHAVVHAHPPHATALAMLRRPIPACHYMIAAFGGGDVRCAAYATFGTEALSRAALAALRGRSACLLANHGIIAAGETLDRAVWRAGELETLARQYTTAMAAGRPVLLSDNEVAQALEAFAAYAAGRAP